MAHRDGYTAFVSSGVGKKLATTLGLPQPVALRRQVPGRPLLDGPLLDAAWRATVGARAAAAARRFDFEVAYGALLDVYARAAERRRERPMPARTSATGRRGRQLLMSGQVSIG